MEQARATLELTGLVEDSAAEIFASNQVIGEAASVADDSSISVWRSRPPHGPRLLRSRIALMRRSPQSGQWLLLSLERRSGGGFCLTLRAAEYWIAKRLYILSARSVYELPIGLPADRMFKLSTQHDQLSNHQPSAPVQVTQSDCVCRAGIARRPGGCGSARSGNNAARPGFERHIASHTLGDTFALHLAHEPTDVARCVAHRHKPRTYLDVVSHLKLANDQVDRHPARSERIQLPRGSPRNAEVRKCLAPSGTP